MAAYEKVLLSGRGLPPTCPKAEGCQKQRDVGYLLRTVPT